MRWCRDFPFWTRGGFSVALRGIFPPVGAGGGCGMLRRIVAVGVGLPLHSVVGRQVAEFSRWSLCGGLGVPWGRNFPCGTRAGLSVVLRAIFRLCPVGCWWTCLLVVNLLRLLLFSSSRPSKFFLPGSRFFYFRARRNFVGWVAILRGLRAWLPCYGYDSLLALGRWCGHRFGASRWAFLIFARSRSMVITETPNWSASHYAVSVLRICRKRPPGAFCGLRDIAQPFG